VQQEPEVGGGRVRGGQGQQHRRAQVLGSAQAGTSKERPDLARTSIPLVARLGMLPCRGGEGLLRRLARGLLTVVDATNVQPESRKPILALAREHDVLPVAIVLNLPAELSHERNAQRPDRTFGPHVVRQQSQQLRRGLRGLEREGFRYVYVLNTPEEVEQVEIGGHRQLPGEEDDSRNDLRLATGGLPGRSGMLSRRPDSGSGY
jgi:hypothetical protein